jgi:HK97 family phage major capsid protein
MSKIVMASALLASSALIAAPRGILGPSIRADATDPKTVLANLTKAFEDFKTENDAKLKAKADVVTDEKVEKISASIGEMQTAFDAMQAKLTAALIRPGEQTGDLPPTDPSVIEDYKAYMRKGSVSAAMDKGTDSNGGYLAPIEWDRTIGKKLKLISPIRANSRVQSITVAGFKKLFSDRAVGSGWVGETATRPQTSTPQIGSLDFVPGELYANPAISQQLLQDAAINLEDWLAEEVDTEFARQEGIAFLSGNGANKPNGVLTYVEGGANAAKHPYGAIATVNSGAAAGLTGDGILDLMYSLQSIYATNAKLYMNRLSMGAARKLKDGQGNYLWQPSYQLGQPQTLAAAPIVEVPDMPLVAAGNIAALYGDMAATYLVIDRLGITVLRDPLTNKPYVHFYTVKRVGGGVYDPQPMRALKIGANA